MCMICWVARQGWQKDPNLPSAADRARGEPIGSVLAERVADQYVRIIRALPAHVVYCPQHRAWRSTYVSSRVKKKQMRSSRRSRRLAEKVLQGPELEALLRVLGADGARCLDAAFTSAAVDEMARCVRGVPCVWWSVERRHHHQHAGARPPSAPNS